MRNLEKHDCVYIEKMRKLRQLTWEAKENNNKFPEQEKLRLQNSILKEIVKSLKKKVYGPNNFVFTFQIYSNNI